MHLPVAQPGPIAATTLADDLAWRWARARCAGLRRALATAAIEVAADASEIGLVARALNAAPDAALRAVFDTCHALGNSFRAHYRADLPLADLAALLPRLGVACARRTWVPIDGEPARRGEHPGCEAPALHPRACAYWREATEGLVLGASGSVRFARHRSRGAGDAACVDVLFVRPESPLRFGPIPDELRAGLAAVAHTARLYGVALQVHGLSEATLFYTATGGADVAIGAVVERAVRRRFPDLATVDVTPRPVLDPQ